MKNKFMISYELALKLKEAGFPNIKICIGRDRPDHYALGCDERFPTLSELIEECGDRFSGVSRNPFLNPKYENQIWCATGMYDNGRHQLQISGISPEEAGANLYLAIHKPRN